MYAKTAALTAVFFFMLSPTLAHGGDPDEGNELFRNCQACHKLTGPNDEKVRTGGQVGPNLYGVIGRPAGSFAGYKYSPGLEALNASGLVWTEEKLASFVSNPNSFLEAQLGTGHTSKMPFALPEGAADIASYLAAAAQ
jgi:cytochrome c